MDSNAVAVGTHPSGIEGVEEIAQVEPITQIEPIARAPGTTPGDWLTVAEAARLACVHTRTVHNWINHGLVIIAVRPTGTPLVATASVLRTGEAAAAARAGRRQRKQREYARRVVPLAPRSRSAKAVPFAAAAEEPARMVSTPATPGSAAITVAAVRRVPLGLRRPGANATAVEAGGRP